MRTELKPDARPATDTPPPAPGGNGHAGHGELAAEIADLSTRTLQRRLADEELTYRDLLADVRYETKIDLMQDPEITVTDIANLPGYTDPSHFARAFRRMAVVNPCEYVQQHL